MDIRVELRGILDDLGKDFKIKNFKGDDIDVTDYMDDEVDFERVKEDRKRCVEYVEEVRLSNSGKNNMEIAVAEYTNFFVKSGMAGRFQAEEELMFDGLEDVLNKSENSDDLKLMYMAIKTQNYDMFWNLLEANPDSVVARLYLFVKYCNSYCKEALEHFDDSLLDTYNGMWKLYETLPDDWKEYVLGSGEHWIEPYNIVADPNLLPYMAMKSTKEYLVEYISSFYDNILKKLDIDSKMESGYVYAEMLEKLGVSELEAVLMELSTQLTEKQNDGIELNNLIRKCCDLVVKLRAINEDLDVTFLIEKLHCLDSIELIQWFEGENFDDDIVMECIAQRNLYLHIPVKVPFSKTLLLSQYEILKKNRKIRENVRKKTEMMDYYAHSWKHIAYPQIVKEIADELSKTNISLANKLIKAYNSEKTLQRGIQLLQLMNSDDEYAICNAFKEGMLKTGSDCLNAVSLKDAFRQSLDLVVFKLLMVESDDSSRMKKCREKWNQYKQLNVLREDYVTIFLESDKHEIEIDQWINLHLAKLDITVDETWDKIRFKEDSFALNQFKEILVEIITNFFLHGSDELRIEFMSDEQSLSICTTNNCDKFNTGSGKGISTMAKVLDGINYGVNISSMDVVNNEEIFQMRIRFNKAILVRRGR